MEGRKRTAEDFRRAQRYYMITQWVFRKCSICETPLLYLFENNEVFFTPDCDCSRGYTPPEPRDWEELAYHYNMQTNASYLDEMDAFWRFDMVPADYVV